MLKRFDLPEPPPPPAEPLEFELAGRHRDKRDPETQQITQGEPFVEKFAVVDYVPFGAMDDLAQTVNIEPDGRVSYGKHATLRFMRRAIVQEDRERWNDLITDPDRIVPIENIVNVMLWVVGETTDRPTGPQSNSRNGSAETADGSEPDSPSPADSATSSTGGDSGSGSTPPS